MEIYVSVFWEYSQAYTSFFWPLKKKTYSEYITCLPVTLKIHKQSDLKSQNDSLLVKYWHDVKVWCRLLSSNFGKKNISITRKKNSCLQVKHLHASSASHFTAENVHIPRELTQYRVRGSVCLFVQHWASSLCLCTVSRLWFARLGMTTITQLREVSVKTCTCYGTLMGYDDSRAMPEWHQCLTWWQ